MNNKNIDKIIYKEYLSSKMEADLGVNRVRHEVEEVTRLYSRYLHGRNVNSRILDIGTGYGKVLLFLREHGFNNTLGIDVSEEACSMSHSIGLKNVLHVDAKDFLRENKETFDIIFALDFLEHLTLGSALDVLKNIKSSLCDNGLLLIQIPNAGSPFGLNYFVNDVSHKLLLGEKSVCQLLYLAGFKRVIVVPLRPGHNLTIKRTCRYVLYMVIETIISFLYLIVLGEKHIVAPNLIVTAHKE